MRNLVLLTAVPIALGGVLVAGGAAYAEGSTCTTSTSGPTTTTCTSTSTSNGSTAPLTESQTDRTGSALDLTTLPARYCIQVIPDPDGGLSGYNATDVQFRTVTTATTTTTYRGRSTKADAQNAKSTSTTGPTVVTPLVVTSGSVDCRYNLG